MKRISIISFLICSVLLTACSNSNIGVIGGADGPTNIIVNENSGKVKGKFGEQYEKRPVRMFNVDGDLYYDSGLVSENAPRCGTLDGELKKTVGENEIPLKSGEANFEVQGYQYATNITKEVNIDGQWLIFRKYDMSGHTLDGLRYCYYIKGHLNNAAIDSEIIVLSEYEDITFNDVYEPLLSSQYPSGLGKGISHHNWITSDKWGITLRADNVTPKGMTLMIEQFGGNPSGELDTGAEYWLEMMVNDEWQLVETKDGNTPIWTALGYRIKKNDVTKHEVNWEYLYGKLSPGFYRLKKEIMDFRAAGDYDKNLYEVYFTIE